MSDTRTIRVTRVTIPPMSSVGMGKGIDVETGEAVEFAGDWRPLRELGWVLADATSVDELPLAAVPDWAVVAVGPGDEGGHDGPGSVGPNEPSSRTV